MCIRDRVSAVLLVDGEVVTLCRRFNEKWTKKRGSAVEEFVGHEEERLYNNVPCSVKEWNEKIAAICPEQVFKFITNPLYFTSQSVDTQRSMLFRMAGGITDEEIAAGNADFAALLASLTGKTMEEYKKEIAAKKRRLKTEIEAIPERIDERRRDVPEAEDWAALEEELRQKQEALAKVEEQLSLIHISKLDAVNFWEQVLFSWLTGNADMHLKNFSLYSLNPGVYGLTPAYDLLSTALVLPEDTEELALTLNGRKRKLRRSDFVQAMTASGIDVYKRQHLHHRR